MRRDDLAHQLRWWGAEYRRRLIGATVRLAAPSARADLVRALEGRDAGREIDLSRLDPRATVCVREDHVVAPAAEHVVPRTADVPIDAGNHWPDRHAYRLTACRVDAATGLVFYGGRVLTASGTGWRPARDSAFLSGAAARAAGPTVHEVGPIAPMGRADNYFHFLVEVLPRVLHVRQVAPDAVPVFAAPMPAFAADVLDTLGIAYRVVDDEIVLRCDDVWVCEPVPSDWPHPRDLDLLVEVIAGSVPRADVAGADRVYVTRQGASRSIADEAMVEAHVTDIGFTVVRMESLSFAEQVAVLREARIVLAPHGAGMANIVFSRPGTRVLELTTGAWWGPCYRNVASMLGLRHVLVRLPWTPERPDGTAAGAISAIDAALAGLPA